MENWKDIPGYEGYYQASDMGRIRSITRAVKHPRNKDYDFVVYGRILKHRFDKNGYSIINLSKDGVAKTHKVHRLIAMAFISNPENYETIDHINCLKYDNRPQNLRWCTIQENTKHREETYDIGDRARYKIVCKETQDTFKSSYDAALWLYKNGYTKNNNYKTVSKSIRECCKGRYHSSCGFHWAYL